MCQLKRNHKSHNKNIPETIDALGQIMVNVPEVLKTYQPGTAQYSGHILPDDNINMTPCSVEVVKADDVNELYRNNDLLKAETIEDMYESYEEASGTPGTPEMTRHATDAV